ncbi:MAG: DUF4349 domain-containing protein [Chloroflexi bacterium]|nr:DUF4349 domain-containing protein [Chloroflexota bacterium]
MNRKRVLVIALAVVMALIALGALTQLGPRRATAPGVSPELKGPEMLGRPNLDLAAEVRQGAQAPLAAPAPASPPTSGWSLISLDRMIIRNGSLSLKVADVVQTVAKVGDIVAAMPDALISASNLRREEGNLKATIVVTVPSAHFQEAMGQLRQLGLEVTGETVTSQDVTEEFVDLESQLRNQKTIEEQYLRLLSKATRIEDILSIQDRLNQIRGQIERTQGRLNFLERKAQMSTITLNILPFLPGKSGAWQPDKTVQEAFQNLFLALGRIADVTIYLAIYALPFIPLALILLWWRHPGRATGASQ